VSDLHTGDVHHEASRRLFEVIEAEGRLVICPEVPLSEVAAAIARATDDSDVVRQSGTCLRASAPTEALWDAFAKEERRKVRRDGTISLWGKRYPVPKDGEI